MAWWPGCGRLLSTSARVRHKEATGKGGGTATFGGTTCQMILFSLFGVTLCLALQRHLRQLLLKDVSAQGEHHHRDVDNAFPGMLQAPSSSLVDSPQLSAKPHSDQLNDSLFPRRANRASGYVIPGPRKAASQAVRGAEGSAFSRVVGEAAVPRPDPGRSAGVAADRQNAHRQRQSAAPQASVVAAGGGAGAEFEGTSDQIGIFQYREGMSRMDAMDTVVCYAARHGYKYFMDTNAAGDECTARYAKSVYYRKQCRVARRLRSVRWLLVLDADSAIVSAGRRIEEWIDDSKDVILYERWLSGEIVAGNYLIKNSPAGHRFLDHWLRFYGIQMSFMAQKKAWFSNFDNGALHLLVAQHTIAESPDQHDESTQEQLAKQNAAGQSLGALIEAQFGVQGAWLTECIAQYAESMGLPGYDSFVACIKRVVPRLLSNSKSIKLFRRGHGFCIDGYVVADMFNPSVGPMCNHGVKAPTWNKLTAKIDVKQCTANPAGFEVPILPTLVVTVDRLRMQLRMKEKVHSNSRPLGWKGVGGVADCWPNCPDPV